MKTLFVVLACFAVALGAGVSFDWLTEAGGLSLILEKPTASLSAALFIASLTSINLVLRWLRWGFLLRRFHVRMPTRETFQIFFATLPAALTPLYVGELFRGALVARRHRHMAPIIIWVWLVERCSDVAALLMLWGWAVASIELAIAGSVLLVLAPWLLASRTLHRPGAEHLHTSQLPAATIVASSAFCSLAAWIIPAVGAQIGLRVFAPVDFELTTAAFVKGTLLGGISGVPGGAGVAGSAMIRHLHDGGIELSAAIASVAVLRAATNWYAVAVGVAVIIVCRKSLLQLFNVPRGEQQHFDELSSTYADGIPEHVRQRLLSRKIDAMLGRLPKPSGKKQPRGLDLGCGHGWYASELVTLGYDMTGIDVSVGQVRQAQAYCRGRNTAVALTAYNGEQIPFPDASFEFVYSINVMHHVIEPDVRERLFAEVVRVLKPGGVFLLHEMNVENTLFRVYMSYVFPLLKRIDEGTELWIRPTRLPAIQGAAWSHDIAYFTFLPEFLPALIQRVFQPFERWLELSKLRKYSAHYMAALRRS